MINVQEARQELAKVAMHAKNEERLKEEAVAIEVAQRKKEALKNFLAIMLNVEKKIKEAITCQRTGISYQFNNCDEHLVHEEVEAELVRLGYKIKPSTYVPWEGADPDSGEGGWRTGPNSYSVYIDW